MQILTITWKDLKILFKDIGGLAALFLMPLAFIVVMSTALGGAFGGGGDNPIEILVVNQDEGTIAADIVKGLDEMGAFAVEEEWEGEPLTQEGAEQLIIDEKHNVAVVFPPDFSEKLTARAFGGEATQTEVLLIVDPALSEQWLGPIRGTLQGLLEKSAFAALAPTGIELMFAQLAPHAPPEAVEEFKAQALRQMSGGLAGSEEPAVTVEQVTPPGMQVEEYPDSYQQNVPGYTVMGVFFIVMTIAQSILREKQEGTFRRLLAAPVGRASILAGKLLPYYIVNILQVAVMFTVARLLFGMEWGDPLGLLVVTLAVAAAATSLGVLVAALGKSSTQIEGVAAVGVLVLAMLGGCMVPTFVMPDFMQTLSKISPHAWAMAGYQDVLVRGYGINGIWTEVGALLGFAALFFTIGVWRFRFD